MGAVVTTVPPDFAACMKRLVGLKFAPSDLTTHWEALRDLAADELDVAIMRATRECDEFPSPKMLRAFVDEHRARVVVPEEDPSRAVDLDDARTVALPDGTTIPVPREWSYYCDVCSDTGMRSFWCGDSPSKRQPWLTVGRCGRRKAHGEHEWVEACPCAPTNPDVIRKQLRAQQVTRGQAER